MPEILLPFGAIQFERIQTDRWLMVLSGVSPDPLLIWKILQILPISHISARRLKIQIGADSLES